MIITERLKNGVSLVYDDMSECPLFILKDSESFESLNEWAKEHYGDCWLSKNKQQILDDWRISR